MGTWGLRPFDNDDASDLFYELKDNGADVRAILAGAIEELDPEYIEIDQGQRAVAAAALLVSFAGGPDRHLSEYELPWAKANPLPDAAQLVPEALAAIERVMADAEHSEIYALWQEQDGGLEDWLIEMNALRDDLKSL